MKKNVMPDDQLQMVKESEELLGRIKLLRSKPRLTLADLK